MEDDDVIVISEKRQIDNFQYKIWPGDENDEKQNETGFYISNKPTTQFRPETIEDFRYLKGLDQYGKRKRDNENTKKNVEEEPVAKRASMTNRYFSSENLKLVSQNKKMEETKAALVESDQFIKRRDTLIKRLLQNRTLPGVEGEQENSEASQTEESEPEPREEKVIAQERKHEFHGEFIPLFQTESDKKETIPVDKTDGESEAFSYVGSYPHRCIKRVREALIQAFKPVQGASFTNRAGEIAKMKVQIPSKFDNDTRLWGRIKRETYQVRQQIRERIGTYKRYETRREAKNKKIEFIELEASDSDEELEEVLEMIEPKKNKKHNKFGDDDSDESNSILSEDLVQREDSDQSDLDSKCVQFGKYSKKSKQVKKAKNQFSREFDSIHNSSGLNSKKKKNNNNNMDEDELDFLKLEFRRLRNARNKAMRSIKKNVKDGASKQMSLEIEREMMNEKMTKVRRMIKKLNRKNKPKGSRKFNSPTSNVSKQVEPKIDNQKSNVNKQKKQASNENLKKKDKKNFNKNKTSKKKFSHKIKL